MKDRGLDIIQVGAFIAFLLAAVFAPQFMELPYTVFILTLGYELGWNSRGHSGQ